MIISIFKICLIFCVIKICVSLEKGCTMSDLDKIMEKIATFQLEFPENDNKINSHCRKYPSDIRNTRSFIKNCTKDASKTLMSVSVHSIEKIYKSMCRTTSDKSKFVRLSKCTNKDKKANKKCWYHMIDSLTLIANKAESKLKIPLMCCTMISWKACGITVLEKNGSQHCSNKDVETMDAFYDKAMIDPMNIFCADYVDSDLCQSVNQKMPKQALTRSKFATPFPAVIEVFDKL
ncbi:uncharacterized protein LOC128953675 [Oppia nitens]|uniref:uncharacterized protein LOC128953675 n=1 Tax=Oppia nitens TaxID=1686743 RepID=UPI0023DC5FCE|nr:uncharacterized protein LOC128953675 [Oppia nitens]